MTLPRGRLARWAGSAARRAQRWLRGPRPTILMYHRVAEESFDPWGLAIAPKRFAAQMEWLAKHRTILPLADFAARHRDGTLSRRAVAITFDDGYACNAEYAAPLLERMGIPATIFLPVELVQRGRDYWWHELERIVLHHRGMALRLDGTEFDLGEKTGTDGSWAAHSPPGTPRQRAYLAMWERLHALAPSELDGAMAELRSRSNGGNSTEASTRPMTPDEVRAVRSTAVEFGSHALTHASLPSLPSDEKAREIRQSAVQCEQLTGTKPLAFAYPFGDFDDESETLVREAGFTCACTTVQRPVSPASRAFALPRIQAGDWPAETFSRMLGGR